MQWSFPINLASVGRENKKLSGFRNAVSQNNIAAGSQSTIAPLLLAQSSICLPDPVLVADVHVVPLFPPDDNVINYLRWSLAPCDVTRRFPVTTVHTQEAGIERCHQEVGIEAHLQCNAVYFKPIVDPQIYMAYI